MSALRNIPLQSRLRSHLIPSSYSRAIGTLPTPPTPPQFDLPPVPSPTSFDRKTRPQLKAEGDFSSTFPSLSGVKADPLPPRFAHVKERLLSEFATADKETHLRKLQESWDRLIEEIEKETQIIRTDGSKVIPQVEFKDLDAVSKDLATVAEIKKRGAVVIKNVISQEEAVSMKKDVEEYIQRNQSQVKAFPPDNPSVYEIYWSPSQVRARSHPNLHKVHLFLLSSLWLPAPPNTHCTIDTSSPVTYADRIRIRPPGDTKLMLGPHIDGGSVERWEDPAYSRVYEKIWQGKWEEYDPFGNVEWRDRANMDLYNGPGACGLFRMWQAWLSLSSTGPREGTLLVNPLLKLSTSYVLLRPFFSPTSNGSLKNWKLTLPPDTLFPNSVPAAAQELSPETHPHLALEDTMVHIPQVQPGDYVAWHCDAVHAVDKEHAGKVDSSVFYIPACPSTIANREYVARQREAFERGIPPPDFPGAGTEGAGEATFEGRGRLEDCLNGEIGRKALGF